MMRGAERSWLVVGGAMALAVLAYWPGLAGPFLLDDFGSVLMLALHQSSGADWLEVLRNAPPPIRGRWLANVTTLVSHAMGGGTLPAQAFAFKAGNLAVHLACGAGVFLLARRVLRLSGEPRAGVLAAAAAMLFLLHPLLLSTVLYPVQRMAQLSTLFLLLAVYTYVRWREDIESLSRQGSLLRVALCMGCALLAFGAKENGVLAPLLFGAAELSLFRWPAKATRARAHLEPGVGLLIVVPLMLGLVALVLRWPRMMGGYARRDYTLPERVLTQVHALWDYLGQIAWPRIGSMGLFHDDFPLQTQFDLPTALLAAGLAALLAGAIALRRRVPAVAFGVLWFFAAHALESTIISLELVFEHRNYLALFGPALVAAWALGRVRQPRIAIALAVLVAAGLSAQTWRRAQDWRTYDSWTASEAAHHPASLRAGTERMLHLAGRGRPAEASAERERLESALPDHAQPAMLKLAFACAEAQPAVEFTRAEMLSLQRGSANKDAVHVYSSIRDALRRRCKAPDWDLLARVAETLGANPRAGTDRATRANWWRFAAGARLQTSDWSGVRNAVRQVLLAARDDPRDWLLLAEAEARLGNRRGYLEARDGLLRLMGGRPGRLAEQLQRVDALARSLAPANPG